MYSRFGQWMPLLLIALLAVLIGLLNMAAQQPDEARQPAPNEPDLVVENANARRFDAEGQLLTELRAASAKHVAQDDTMWFEQVRLTQNSPGQPTLTIVGQTAKTVHRASEVWFYGDVDMHREASKGSPALSVKTQDLYIDTQARIARSSKPVVAEMGAHRARAVGFVVDHGKETVELLSQVSMTYVPK